MRDDADDERVVVVDPPDSLALPPPLPDVLLAPLAPPTILCVDDCRA